MNDISTITDRDNALFEAGIKLGALYHQFTGSPVNLKTVKSLEHAIEQSISVQPFVEDITVSINRDMILLNMNNKFGYCELEGRMLDVRIIVRYGLRSVQVALLFDEEMQYPLMRIITVG
ncbi:MAG: dihydroneopterin aldolase family protein [Methanosarcinaceae archaeon]